ncbi:PBECR2 nuclease fold domain-containing protein, partial [Campylobacter upsaliensis]|uniref:PBECR2 nuclease fold domain-containing protein n=1 Tax=Campylobacter upsaliensis TaxID=28080 RepID=UPI00214A0DCE
QNEALHRAQKAWLEAFGLKSIDEAYTPKFSKEVSEALEKVLNGEQIKLTKGSYEKLLKRDREEFLPFIKETLENADAVVKQADGALIFAKDYRNEKLGKFFASVSRNDKGEWVITSNAPKTLNNLKNKIEEGGELLYSDLPELPIIAKPELTAEALNGEANLSESIPQNSEKLPFEMQVLAEDKLSGDEVRHLANKIGEKSTMAYFKDYLLKMDRDFHARAKDIIREYYRIEPFRKELENQWANVKEAYKNGEMSLKEFKFLSKYKDEGSFLNQIARVLWHHNDELVKNRGYTINKYGGVEQGKGDNYYQNLALEYDGALKSLKKWFYYIQKANKQAQKFFNKKELEEFGVNFEGFKGKEAVLKLLEEKRGQVKGAFYKEGLG